MDDLETFLNAMPSDGSAVGNVRLRRALGWDETRYGKNKNELLESGLIRRGQGRGGTVSRVDLASAELESLKTTYLETLPQDGSTVGNRALRRALSWDESRYETVKRELLDAGLISKHRGAGGAVKRASVTPAERVDGDGLEAVDRAEYQKELALYPPFEEGLRRWAKSQGWVQHDLACVGSQGRRRTGGLWSRPDFLVVGVRSYDYTPNKIRDVETWEIKTSSCSIAAVFEAAAHSRAATKSYLAINKTHGAPSDELLTRIESECVRFGIGLITFERPDDPSSWRTRVEATRREPDPSLIEEFMRQAPENLKTALRQWLR